MTSPWRSSDLAVTELWPRRDWAVTSPSRDWAVIIWPGAVTTVVTVSSQWAHRELTVTIFFSWAGFEVTKDTPYLSLTGELWGVFYEDLLENRLCYTGTTLYCYAQRCRQSVYAIVTHRVWLGNQCHALIVYCNSSTPFWNMSTIFINRKRKACRWSEMVKDQPWIVLVVRVWSHGRITQQHNIMEHCCAWTQEKCPNSFNWLRMLAVS